MTPTETALPRSELDRGPRVPHLGKSSALAELEAMEAQLDEERRGEREAATHDDDDGEPDCTLDLERAPLP